MDVLDDGRLQTVATLGQVVDANVGQALRTVDFDKLSVGIDLAAADTTAFSRSARHAQRDHAAILHCGSTREDLEVHIGHHISDFCEFQIDAQIRLIRTIHVHRFLVRHHRELSQINANGVLEHRGDHALEHVPDFFFTQERSLNINLRELWLAVCTQVFVAEAFGDLVVAVKARHHEQLLEQLGGLRQGKEMAIVHTAGHQIVARAFGRGLGQHGGFDIHKTIGIQKLANFHGHAVAQHQVVLHVRAAQVQHTVRQTCGF